MKLRKILIFIFSVMLPAVVLLAHTTTASSITSKDVYYVFVSPDAYYKTQGSQVTFTGSHFYPYEKIFIRQNGILIGSLLANQFGDMTTSSFSIPYTAGVMHYSFSGSVSRISFPVNITVGQINPWITLNTYYAGAGSPLILMGHGYASSEVVNVWFENMNLGSVITNSNGEFILSASVPIGNTGQRTIQALGLRSNTRAQQSFSQAY